MYVKNSLNHFPNENASMPLPKTYPAPANVSGNFNNPSYNAFNTNYQNTGIQNLLMQSRIPPALLQQLIPAINARLQANAVVPPTGNNVAAPANFANLGSSNGMITVSGMEGLQRYIDAVDNNGNVDNDKIHGGITDERGAVSTYDARTSIVEGYAAEFYAGGRIRDPNLMAQMSTILWQDFNSSNPNARDAATFSLVAARYKNAGGNYDNATLAELLKNTNNQDLITGGVGETDVETLAAVTMAIKRGTLGLGQIFGENGTDSQGGQSVGDVDKYRSAIDAIKRGNLGDSIENGSIPYTAGGPRFTVPFTYTLNGGVGNPALQPNPVGVGYGGVQGQAMAGGGYGGVQAQPATGGGYAG